MFCVQHGRPPRQVKPWTDHQTELLIAFSELDFKAEFNYETGDGGADAFMQALNPASFLTLFNTTTHRKAARRSPDVWDLLINRLQGLKRESYNNGTMFGLSGIIMYGMNKCPDVSSFYLVSVTVMLPVVCANVFNYNVCVFILLLLFLHVAHPCRHCQISCP